MLRALGYRFACQPADVDETPQPAESPPAFAARMALGKARAAAARAPTSLPVLGADTDVSVDGRILGKPSGRDDALAMLARLSGRSHQVCSAVAMVSGTQTLQVLTVTEVHFGVIAPADALAYWNSGEPADKAGAYAIQGGAARWVREIRGSYTGVVGLPLLETCELLARCGIHPEPAA
ncbi:MAG: septum formation inhibitor Maf [Hydrocarboniphaga sp.]|nr:septum formation inhibitor Maf [Hydrocarboniphaga sp.]